MTDDIFEPGEPGFYTELVFRYDWPPDFCPAEDLPDKWGQSQSPESAAKRARAAENLTRRMVGQSERTDL
jgi:hypothetical protein